MTNMMRYSSTSREKDAKGYISNFIFKYEKRDVTESFEKCRS
jgi:hypothetical protein